MITAVRPPAVAGTFYPGVREELTTMVSRQLDRAAAEAADHMAAPRALIAPHAGFIYSGYTAAAAFTTLIDFKDQFSRVVLLGPSHHYPIEGIVTTHSREFETPLGLVKVDMEGIAAIESQAAVSFDDNAHAPEHALETHLPFLQSVLPSFSIVPCLVGHCPEEEVRVLIERLWDMPGTLISVSSDLSHYKPYDRAVAYDRETSGYIEALNSESITPSRACGCYAVRGLLSMARTAGLTAEILEVCNSGDTAGDRSRVVGYGAYAFYE